MSYEIRDFEDRIKKFNYVKALQDLDSGDVLTKGKIYKLRENVLSDECDEIDNPTVKINGDNGDNYLLFTEFRDKKFIFVTDKYMEKHKEKLVRSFE